MNPKKKRIFDMFFNNLDAKSSLGVKDEDGLERLRKILDETEKTKMIMMEEYVKYF